MANYLASIFGTEQDKVNCTFTFPFHPQSSSLLTSGNTQVRSTIKLVPAVMVTAAPVNTSSLRTRRQFSFRICTRIPRLIRKIR